MLGQQLFFLLICFGAVNCGQLIFLDAIDSSWIVSGYQTKINSPINITTSCSNCTIQVLAIFEYGTVSNTSFVISDTFGTTIQSSNTSLRYPVNFKGSLTMIDKSPTPSYSLSFRLILPNETFNEYADNDMTFVINNRKANNYTSMSSGNGSFVIFTAMPFLWSTPTIAIQPTGQVNAGCEYSLYRGGIPSRSGASKYLINQFHAGNSGNLSFLSFIPSYAATVYVPPNCAFSVDLEDFTGTYNGSSPIIINSVPRTGFVMSRNYPGAMDGGGNSGMNIDLKYALSTQIFGNRTAQFSITVDNYYSAPGSTQFSLWYDDKVGYIFNSSTTNYTDSRNAKSFQIKFTPGNSTFSNFLLHFSTQVFDMPTTTTLSTNTTATTPITNTTTTTTIAGRSTTLKGVHQLQIFVSILLCLCSFLKMQ